MQLSAVARFYSSWREGKEEEVKKNKRKDSNKEAAIITRTITMRMIVGRRDRRLRNREEVTKRKQIDQRYF